MVSTGVMLASLAACGGDDSSDSSNDDNGGTGGETSASGEPWILGTTETITSMDPAGSYDIGSWNMQYSIFEQLLSVPAGETDPVGDAAESCEYEDPQTVTCTLREGITFSNGNELTSSDVKFSMERNIAIADPNGASGLLAQLAEPDAEEAVMREDAVETPDDLTVTFNLNTPDTTFLKLLSTAVTSIVDEETFPADELAADDAVIGSGPFQLSQFKAGEQAVLEANESYSGERTPQAQQVFVQFFSSAGPLKEAIETQQVDVAWRTLGPTELNDLQGSEDVEVFEGEGSEYRYWVFQLANPTVEDVAVRQAVAQIIDREVIAQDAYDGTVTPAYSIVPPGFPGQKDSFQEMYGEPDPDAAAKILEDAGVETPVELTLGYTPTRYGPNSVDEANEIASQLEDSGLFTTSIDSAEWEQYQTLYKENAYDLFQLAWYPDILDTDNYISPFIRDGGFYANNYSNEQVNELIDQELAETDEQARNQIFEQLQDIAAEDVPVVPTWFGKNVAVATPAMSGVQETLDPTYIFRMWDISKEG
jgi:peptide/nickel transport system substrate-binding protein